jgi:hypothetical protein
LQGSTSEAAQSNRPGPAGSKLKNPLGITDIVGRDGKTTILCDIGHAIMLDVAHATMLTECISNEVFHYKQFVILEAESDYGMTLQKRVRYKMNVLQEQDTWWSSHRELVQKTLAKKGQCTRSIADENSK